jgi:Protein of unknown function (DUF4231)
VSFVDTSKEKQNQEDIIALKNEILELKGPLKNYAINRVLKPVEQFRKSWKKSRHYEQLLQYIIIIAGALVSIASVTGSVYLLPSSPPSINFISAILGGSIVISTGILQFQKYHEEWIMYKDTKAKLMYEFYCYKYRINDYKTNPTSEENHNTEEGTKKGSYKLSNIVQDSSSNDVIDEYEDIDSKFVRRVENILLSEATSFVALFKSNQNEGSRPGPGMINP